MKRSVFLIMALLIAAPAMGTVTITCNDEGSGVVSISYTVTGEPAKARAFALDVTVDSGATIEDVSAFPVGEGNKYGIFPGSIDLTDPNIPVWGNPIAPSSDPGAEGTGLTTNRVIIEMGSLYDPDVYGGPADSNELLRLQLEGNGAIDCNVAIVVEPTRGGVVLENGGTVGITSPGCKIVFVSGPPCWNDPGGGLTQCHGDCNDDALVNISDWPAFRDAFGKTYPDAAYNPCGDYNRDGTVNISDWPSFRDNFGKPVPADCALGGTWPPS
jgi:hypothetical protein